MFGMPLGRRRLAHPGREHAAVGARADAGPLAIAPIGQIVLALLARLSVVGDLVGWQSRGPRQVLRQRVEVSRCLSIWDAQLPAPVERCERRVRLDRELIERQVPARQRQGSPEFLTPGAQRLAWPRVNHIEGVARERGARYLDGRPRL